MKYITTINETQYEIEILNPRQVSINGKVVEVDFKSVSGQPIYSLLVDGQSYQAHVYTGEEDELQVLLRGVLHSAKVEDEREKRLRAAAGGGAADSGEFVLKAPMPGLVVKVSVNEGDDVKKGDVLVILESMKMQNELKSPRDGKVTRIQVKAGDSVEQRTSMVSVE
ncbi:MAG TPA: biotin/lipoyl-binding protein [Anaerolineales bacterium]|nr:biotin/lipoyl-binding protein [Anaerolineales bacterium]HRQ93213.1 biotin/lipoyl-binding protein [Anaerolineales bacterium]